MTGNKFGRALQRAVGRCETVGVAEYNSSLSFQSKDFFRVELDGSPVIERLHCQMWREWVNIHQAEWYRGAGIFVSFMQKYDTVCVKEAFCF